MATVMFVGKVFSTHFLTVTLTTPTALLLLLLWVAYYSYCFGYRPRQGERGHSVNAKGKILATLKHLAPYFEGLLYRPVERYTDFFR